jgi:hypothetical protein
MKCFELAPKRFGWRTRPELPDLQRISVARRDAIKKQKAIGIELISAKETEVAEGKPVKAYKWRLNSAGNAWIDEWEPHLKGLYGGGTVPTPRNRPSPTRLREVRASTPFASWQSEGRIESEVWELADLLECSPSSATRVWTLRMDRLQSIAKAENDQAVLGFVNALREWIHEGRG